MQPCVVSPPLAVTSKQSCTDLQKEKEEVCTSSEEALTTLKERHKEELVQLEDRCASHLVLDAGVSTRTLPAGLRL